MEDKDAYIEEMIVARIENLVYMVRDAVVDCTTKLPFIASFQFYIERISTEKTARYVASLLHECWCLVNPYYLVNQVSQYKTEDLDKNEELLDKIICYDKSKLPLQEETDKGLLNLWINTAVSKRKQEGRLGEFYNFQEYLDKVNNCFRPCVERFGLQLEKNFIVKALIPTKELSKTQITELTNYLIKREYIQDADRSNFIGCLSSTINLSTATIRWNDVGERNKTSNVASLYWLFKTLGVDMSKPINKTNICKIFTNANGDKIEPKMLKVRELSTYAKSFIHDIEDILSPND